MRSGKSSPDAAIVKTDQERLLCRMRIPAYLWNPRTELIHFRATKFRGVSLSAVAQKQWVKKLAKSIPRKAPLVVIGSEPTDTGGLHLALYMLVEYNKLTGRDVATVDTAQDVPRLETYPGCMILHNILEKATPERVQSVRDIIARFHYTVRLVVISGTKEPERWAVSKAGLYPDVVLRVKDLTPEQLRAE